MCYCNPHRLKMVDIIAEQLKKKTFSETMLGTKLLAQLEAKEVMLQ